MKVLHIEASEYIDKKMRSFTFQWFSMKFVDKVKVYSTLEKKRLKNIYFTINYLSKEEIEKSIKQMKKKKVMHQLLKYCSLILKSLENQNKQIKVSNKYV